MFVSSKWISWCDKWFGTPYISLEIAYLRWPWVGDFWFLFPKKSRKVIFQKGESYCSHLWTLVYLSNFDLPGIQTPQYFWAKIQALQDDIWELGCLSFSNAPEAAKNSWFFPLSFEKESLTMLRSWALGELLSHFGCSDSWAFGVDLSLFCDWSCASVEAPKKKKKAAAEAPFFRHVALHFKPQGRLHDGDDGDANICKIQMTSGTVFFFPVWRNCTAPCKNEGLGVEWREILPKMTTHSRVPQKPQLQTCIKRLLQLYQISHGGMRQLSFPSSVNGLLYIYRLGEHMWRGSGL